MRFTKKQVDEMNKRAFARGRRTSLLTMLFVSVLSVASTVMFYRYDVVDMLLHSGVIDAK